MLAAAIVWAFAPGPEPIPAAAPPSWAAAPEHVEVLEVVPVDERDIERAKAIFSAGKQAAQAGRWSEAIRFFAQAYRISGSPGQLYSMGRGHRELYFHDGRDPVQLRLALLRLRQYLTQSPYGRNRANARRFIEELQPYVAVLEGFDDEAPPTRLMVFSPVDGAAISIDEGASRSTPITADVEPGRHRISVTAVGYQGAQRSLVVPEGATLPVEIPLVPLPASLAVSGLAGARVMVDGRDQGPLPLSQPLTLPAGPHRLAVTKHGRVTDRRALSLRRGQTGHVDAVMPLTIQRKAAIATLSVGGTAMLGSAVLAGLALRSQSRAEAVAQQREGGGVSVARYQEGQRAWDRRNALRTAAISTGAVSVVAIGTGVALMLTDAPARGTQVRVSARAGPGHAMATVTGHFGP